MARKGVLMAAFRQGSDEIGMALKAFPDSISVSEPGALLNPTQGEIADENRGGSLAERMQESRERLEATQDKEPVKSMERE